MKPNARRLNRSVTPGPFHGFTISKSGKYPLHQDVGPDGRMSVASLKRHNFIPDPPPQCWLVSIEKRSQRTGIGRWLQLADLG